MKKIVNLIIDSIILVLLLFISSCVVVELNVIDAKMIINSGYDNTMNVFNTLCLVCVLTILILACLFYLIRIIISICRFFSSIHEDD